MMQNDEDKKRKDVEGLRNFSKVQDLEAAKNLIEKQLQQEKEKNRALRFKAG